MKYAIIPLALLILIGAILVSGCTSQPEQEEPEVIYITVTVTSTPTPTISSIPTTQTPITTSNVRLTELIYEFVDEGYSRLAGSALTKEQYNLAIDYAEQAEPILSRMKFEAKGLGVTREYQTIKSVFIECIELKEQANYDTKKAAECLRDNELRCGIEYMERGTDNLNKLVVKEEELLYLIDKL